MEQPDVVVIGAGIAGGALATALARHGVSVLVLEQSEVYVDRVRGEWLSPWGVAEAQRLGLYELLVDAGGHHVTRHVTFGDRIDPALAPATALEPTGLIPDVRGPLCLRHPSMCDLLHRVAETTR